MIKAFLKKWFRRIFFKIVNIIKKRKKKNYSYISRFRLYEIILKQEVIADEKSDSKFMYISQPSEYVLNSSREENCKEDSIWELKQIGEIFPPMQNISCTPSIIEYHRFV